MRPFFLDPRFWLALLVWSLMLGFGAYVAGSSEAREKAKAEEQVRTNAALHQLAVADAESLRAERHLRELERATFDQFLEDQEHAKADTDRLIAGLRAGAVRLRVPVRAPDPAAPAADRSPPGSPGEEGHAELTPDAGEFVVDLLDRGDEAIRKHAALVDLYEQARLTCNGQPPAAEPEIP